MNAKVEIDVLGENEEWLQEHGEGIHLGSNITCKMQRV